MSRSGRAVASSSSSVPARIDLAGAVEIRGQGFAASIAGDGDDMHAVADVVGCIFAADIAAFDEKQAVIAKADEGSGLGLLRLVEDGRTVFEIGDERITRSRRVSSCSELSPVSSSASSSSRRAWSCFPDPR